MLPQRKNFSHICNHRAEYVLDIGAKVDVRYVSSAHYIAHTHQILPNAHPPPSIRYCPPPHIVGCWQARPPWSSNLSHACPLSAQTGGHPHLKHSPLDPPCSFQGFGLAPRPLGPLSWTFFEPGRLTALAAMQDKHRHKDDTLVGRLTDACQEQIRRGSGFLLLRWDSVCEALYGREAKWRLG